MQLTRRWATAGVALVLSALAGAALAQAPEKKQVTLAVGGKGLLYYLPLTITERLGYFKDEGLNVRISDFALAQRIQKASFFSSWFRRKGLTQGTRSYMSPEQIRGEDLDGRADIYTFAASMYEIVAYRPPFRAGSNQELLNKQISEKPVSPQTHNPDLTDEFSELVLQMLAKKREQRPADFNQVLMRLQKMRVYKSGTAAKTEEQ